MSPPRSARRLLSRCVSPLLPCVSPLFIAATLLCTAPGIGTANQLYAITQTTTQTTTETARFELASAVELAKQRIASFEGADSLTPLEDAIANYELAVFRDSIDLAHPWMLLGDAHLQAGNPQAAATAYEQSIHITRVNLGLFTPEQLDAVHRQAALFNTVGDHDAATGREEYALVLQRRKSSAPADLVPALERMGDWYMQVSEPVKARQVYREATVLLERSANADPDLRIPAYLGLAESYLLERFPRKGFYQQEERDFPWQGPEARMTGWDVSQGMFFGPAHRALLSAEALLRTRADESKAAKERLSDVLVRLGDVNLLFEKWSSANAWYAAVFDLWRDSHHASEDADTPFDAILNKWFEKPTPLHLPLPTQIGRVDEYPPERIDIGHITLAFSLSSQGKVGRIETVEIHPSNLRDIRFRRVLRESRYRPRIEQGVAVRSERLVHRHEFLYIVKDDADAPVSETEANNTDESTDEDET